MQKEIETVGKLVETIVEFLVAYGFQLAGALAFLGVGLVLANWVGKQVTKLAKAKNIDVTLSGFIGNVVKLVLIVFLAIITLGNFGITIAPLIALAGASAFGATLAIQGPLSNYGAGLSIVLSRPFVVGNTVSLQDVCGVVDEITLAATILVGEDGERIRIPNKDIVGQVIINSDTARVVETKLFLAAGTDTQKAIDLLGQTLGEFSEVTQDPAPQIGVHDFAYGGVILGMRFWVPSRKYFQTRYAVNGAALRALEQEGIDMSPANSVALAAPAFSTDSGDIS